MALRAGWTPSVIDTLQIGLAYLAAKHTHCTDESDKIVNVYKKKLTLQCHGCWPSISFQRLRPEWDVPEVYPCSRVVYGEPELVHGLEAFGDVVEDVV